MSVKETKEKIASLQPDADLVIEATLVQPLQPPDIPVDCEDLEAWLESRLLVPVEIISREELERRFGL